MTVAAVCSCPSIVIVLRHNLGECLQRNLNILHYEGGDTAEQVPDSKTADDGPKTLARQWILKLCGTVFLISTATAIAIFVPGLDVIFGLTGSLTASIIIYFIPSVLFLHLDPKDSSLGVTAMNRALAWIFAAWGVIMGVVCSVYIVVSHAA